MPFLFIVLILYHAEFYSRVGSRSSSRINHFASFPAALAFAFALLMSAG